MLYCTSTVHHPPSSQVVEFPLATACWAEGEEAQGRALCCILGWKLFSSVSEFLEKTFHCGSFFFFFPRGPSCAGELLSSCWLTTLSLGLEEAFSHLCSISFPCSLLFGVWTSYPPILHSCPEKSFGKKSIRAKLLWLLPGQHRMSLGWMGKEDEGRTRGRTESANKL